MKLFYDFLINEQYKDVKQAYLYFHHKGFKISKLLALTWFGYFNKASENYLKTVHLFLLYTRKLIRMC